ncbi:MAG: hypothetical protein ACE5JP_17740 [Candidatus Bipolaricaulia bacterium]
MASRKDGSDLGCFALLLLAGGLVFAYNLLLNWWTARSFESILPEAKQLCNTVMSHSSMTAAHRTGPVLLVHADSGRIHGEFRGLNPSVRATNSADVATIACLQESRSSAGRYTDGAVGYVIVWEVSLIDLKGEHFVGAGRFRGSSPPRVKKSGGSRTGDPPKEELRRWFVNLPVRTLSNPTPTE